MHEPVLPANWASLSLAERALAYNRIRLSGSFLILLLMLLLQLLYPTDRVIQAIWLTSLDILLLVFQRWLTYHHYVQWGMVLTLAMAALIGTLGMHFGGGAITVSIGIYLVLIMASAFVFLNRRAAFFMAGGCTLLYLVVAWGEFQAAPWLPHLNSVIQPMYTTNQTRLTLANVILGVILMSVTAVLSGQVAETLGQWNRHLSAAITQRTRELTTLLDSSREITASLDLSTTLQRISQHAQEIFQANTTRLYLLPPDSQILDPVIIVGEDAAAIRSVHPRIGEGVTGRVAQTGMAMLVNQPNDPYMQHVPGTVDDPESLLAVPLKYGSEHIGVMVVTQNGWYKFSHNDLRLLAGLADQAANAITKARLYEEAQREIAERQTITEALHASNRYLEETLVQLETTQQQAQQRERLVTVGQLTSGIAHDFNNVLTIILLQAHIVRRHLPVSYHRHLETIALQGQRAAELVRQLLDFTRHTSTKSQPMSLAAFMKEMKRLLQRTLPETIVVELSMDEEATYMVRADPVSLQQLFLNLAINARDAMPQGGELHFSLNWYAAGETAVSSSPLAEGKWLQLQIRDTGHGMSPEISQRAFDPFFTTKPAGQGTGLGLTQVQSIVAQHRGLIQVHSTPGQGTEFTIYLPAITDAPLDQDTNTEGVDEVPGQGETILVVEDDAMMRTTLIETLVALRYHVIAAANGHEALLAFESYGRSIALVITDLVMPQMGGATLFAALRHRAPDIKVVIITGHPLEMRVKELLEQGVVGWLQKPFAPHQFSQVIATALSTPVEVETAPSSVKIEL